MLAGDLAVVCMDGVDVISKLVEEGKAFRGVHKALKSARMGNPALCRNSEKNAKNEACR